MTEITRTAAFGPFETAERVLTEISCPGCGCPPDTYRLTGRAGASRVRFFCDGCGAFVTIVLSEAQAVAVRRAMPRC